jgi:hypothetical protein
MRRNLFFIFFSVLCFPVFAHDFFFAFAEMEYNTSSKKMESTLIVSTHELEHWLQSKEASFKELENSAPDNILYQELASKLLSGFAVKSEKNKDISLSLIGFEIMQNGVTHFFFSSKKILLKHCIHVRFDLWMDKYPEQQNKLTFLYQGNSQTLAFLHNCKEQTLPLKK